METGWISIGTGSASRNGRPTNPAWARSHYEQPASRPVTGTLRHG